MCHQLPHLPNKCLFLTKCSVLWGKYTIPRVACRRESGVSRLVHFCSMQMILEQLWVHSWRPSQSSDTQGCMHHTHSVHIGLHVRTTPLTPLTPLYECEPVELHIKKKKMNVFHSCNVLPCVRPLTVSVLCYYTQVTFRYELFFKCNYIGSNKWCLYMNNDFCLL